jgi:hypothetical protein
MIRLKVYHWELAKQLHLLEEPCSPFYKYEPQNVLENVNYKLYWYRTLHVLRHKNIPHITLVDSTNNKAASVDITIPFTHNLHATSTKNKGNIRILVANQAKGATEQDFCYSTNFACYGGSPLTLLIKDSPQPIYLHVYCPRSRKPFYYLPVTW